MKPFCLHSIVFVFGETSYTKHFFAGSERICSKLGGGLELAPVDPMGEGVEALYENHDEIAQHLYNLLHRFANCNPEPYVTAYIDMEPYLGGIQEWLNRHEPEENRFFYHPDHLGSSSFITDAAGEGYQHLQYMPFGETSVSQKISWWSTPYQFTGKEKDDETGYNYFGARYYNSDLSVWLSVDPMAGERSWLSPYNYCQLNPNNRFDIDGCLDHGWVLNIETGERTKINSQGGDQFQVVHLAKPLEDGGLQYIDTKVIEGSTFYDGPTRGGWGVSNNDLWAGLSEEYNRNSFDWGTGGLYEYSSYDLRKRHEILTNPELSSYAATIISWEAKGLAQPIHLIEYNRQLNYKYGSNDGYIGAYALGYFHMILEITSGISHSQPARNASRMYSKSQVPLSVEYGCNVPSAKPDNPWNYFLQSNKGKYKGADWIKRASDDYYLWKSKRGL